MWQEHWAIQPHTAMFSGVPRVRVRVPSGGLSTVVLVHSTDSSHGVGLRLWRCNTSTVQRQQLCSAAQNGRDQLMLRHCSPLFLTNANGWYGLHSDTPCVSPLCLVFPVNTPHTSLLAWCPGWIGAPDHLSLNTDLNLPMRTEPILLPELPEASSLMSCHPIPCPFVP